MRNGRLFERPMLAPLIAGSASSCWPTATAMDSIGAGGRNESAKRGSTHAGTSLTDAVKEWGTPSVADTTGGHKRRGGKRSQELLLPGQALEAMGVRMWAASTATDHKGSSQPGQLRGQLSEQVEQDWYPTPTAASYGSNAGGASPGPKREALESLARHGRLSRQDEATKAHGRLVLNPLFVEWLMGLRGWMPSVRLETPYAHNRLNTLFEDSSSGSGEPSER